MSVLDTNDNPPVIRINAVVDVPENQLPGAFVAQFSVDDPDSGQNGKTSCWIFHENFTLQQVFPSVFKIVSNVSFDRELADQHHVEIFCRDFGHPSLNVTHDLLVRIADVNDFHPIFTSEQYIINILETCPIGTQLTKVLATDSDIGPNGQVFYQLDQSVGLLKIDENTGLITTAGNFDFENQTRLEFSVVASDRGTPPNSATVSVTVNILDVNDEVPSFSRSSYSFGTFENQHPGTEIGYVSASDRDSPPYDKFVFSMLNLGRPNPLEMFHIDPDSGRITAIRSLDREQYAVHRIIVVVTDVGFPHFTSTANVTIHVADRNDNAPLIEYPPAQGHVFHVSSQAPRGRVFAKISARDADLGENARLTFSIAKGNEDERFVINPLNGELSIGDTELKSAYEEPYRLLIMVKDAGKPEKTAVTTIEVMVNKSAGLSSFDNIGAEIGMRKSEEFLFIQQHIIIIICAASALLVVVIIVIVACIVQSVARKRDQRARRRLQNLLRNGDVEHFQNDQNKIRNLMPVGVSTVNHEMENLQLTSGTLTNSSRRPKKTVQFAQKSCHEEAISSPESDSYITLEVGHYSYQIGGGHY